MQRKSLVTTAAVAGSLALGLIAGPIVADSIASAQTSTPTPSASAAPSTSAAPSASGAPSAASSLRESFLDNLAAALNIQRSALNSAITSAGNTTVDQAAQQGTLTQAQADALKARIQAGDPGALWSGRGGSGGRGGPGGHAQLPELKQAMSDAAAQALGITTDELRAQLRSGQTLAQLAQANNTTEQAVINAALAAAKTQLDQAVANGTLTQAQADTIYADLQTRGANLFSERGHGSRGKNGSPTTPEASPSATAAPNA